MCTHIFTRTVGTNTCILLDGMSEINLKRLNPDVFHAVARGTEDTGVCALARPGINSGQII